MKQSAYDLDSNSPPLLPHDEVLSNILHILWSNTSTSPFLCSSPLPPERNVTTTTSNHGDCDTPFHLFSLFYDAFKGGEQSGFFKIEESIASSTTKKTYKYFLQNFLADFLDANCKKWEGDLERVFKIFMTNLHHEGGEDGDLSAMSDERLWVAGLKLLQRILFDSDEEIDSIAPHELLRTVMDSFHFQDKELEISNFIPINHQLSRQRAQTQNIHELSQTYYHYPSSVAMFILYILLVSHAIHLAATQTEESLSALELRGEQHTGQRTTVIRWRRLKSMVDDAQSIYQRMLLQLMEKTARKNWCSDDDGIDRNCDNSSGNSIGPIHILHLASWLYTNHLLPSFRQLLMLILKNAVKTNANPSSNPKIWEPCMNSFGILTKLVALNFCFAKNHDLADISPSTTSTNWSLLVVKCIDDSLNNELYDSVASSMTMSAVEGIGEETSPERKSDNTRYYIGRGGMLAEDILLLPLGCHKNNSYDELGIAVIAYHRLVAQTQQSKNNQPTLATLPCPFSGGHLWALYFPNIKTLLDGPWKSSILKTLISPETPSSPIDDEFIALTTVKITVLGLDMLHKLIHEAPFVRPSHQYLESTRKHNRIWNYSHSSKVLGSTIEALLSLVLRISTLEAAQSAEKSQRNKVKTGSNNNLALIYTSQQVASMAKSLMGFYTPSIQVTVIREISRKMKQDNVDAVLLPKVLDWMRPLLMNICKNTASSTGISRDISLAYDMTTVMDPLLADLENTFDESSPLPRDVCEFFSSIETFTSLFALFRLLKTWIIQANIYYETMGVHGDGGAGHDSLSRIVVWADRCTEKLIKFDSRLSLLIDYWTQFASGQESNHSMLSSEEVDGCPHDFHRCFLLRFHLDEVLSIK